MKALSYIYRTLRLIFWILLPFILIVVAVLRIFYSPWGQNAIKDRLLAAINSREGVTASLDSIRIHFPLDISLSGLSMVQDGDTLVKADKADIKVALLPLLGGEVKVSKLNLFGAGYQMGNRDSAMMLKIAADTLVISPATVKLSPIDIDVSDGRIAHGRVSMYSRPDSVQKEQSDSVQAMTVRVHRLVLDDFAFSMDMLPIVDSLGLGMAHGEVNEFAIDLKEQTITGRSFIGRNLSAAYIAADSLQIANTPVYATDTVPSPPWTINIDSIAFHDSNALYTTHGLKPQPGLDFSYIQVDDMDLVVTNFYNRATEISLPISFSGTERCGVQLKADGTFAMDSAAMRIKDFTVQTPSGTLLTATGVIGNGDMMADPTLPLALKAKGKMSVDEITLMFPAASPLSVLGSNNPITIDINADGSLQDLNLTTFDIGINRIFKLKASGIVKHALDLNGITGDVNLRGEIFDAESIVKAMAQGTGLKIPPMTLNGNIAMNRGNIDAALAAHTLRGRIALDAKFKSRSEDYALTIDADSFPINAFMPDLGIGMLSAQANASGHLLDIMSPKAVLHANATASLLQYGGYDYHGIGLKADLEGGQAKVNANIDTENAVASIAAQGNLSGDRYDWSLDGNINKADLQALKLMPEKADLMLSLSADATIMPSQRMISAHAILHNMDLGMDNADYNISDIRATFETDDSITSLQVVNRDFVAFANVTTSLDGITQSMDAVTNELHRQLAVHELHIDSIQPLLPKFDVKVGAGTNNFINDILSQSGMSVERLDMTLQNDTNLRIDGRAVNFLTPTLLVDTIGLNGRQKAGNMHIIAGINNKPGNLDDWAHVRLDAILGTNQLTLRAAQKNSDMVQGYDLGLILSSSDSTIHARIFTLQPVIGYRKWNVNINNHVSYNPYTHNIDADLRMRSDKSRLELYTVRPDQLANDSLAVAHNGSHAGHGLSHEHQHSYNDVILNIEDIHIQDWISINPFAPPISGDLSAHLLLDWDGAQEINGEGTMTLADFTYDKQRVGTFEADVDVETSTSGSIKAEGFLNIDQQKVVTITGCLNDSISDSPVNVDMQVIRFPLAIANPFLPADMARLSGMLNGQLLVTGELGHPRFNGEVNFNQAAVKLVMTNTSYAFSESSIRMTNNVVAFDDFTISGANDNPISINGKIDMTSLADPRYNLAFKANNFMFVNSSSASKDASIYGKGYIDLDASVRGNMKFMLVNADLTVLSGTNITYLLTSSASTLQAPSETDMVKFVNFSDSTLVARADSINQDGMMMIIDANLNLQRATTIAVDLATASRDRVVLQPQGSLTYTQSPVSEGRVTGRININGGYARYTIPVIGSEKEFTFDPSSYVAFNGDMMNPLLNIKATDRVKTNVTQTGQNSRLVNFDIILGVTGSLETMDVKFDLTTSDDLTVSNELQGMTPEQRANQAMNLLLYNVYTGPGTKGNANLGANPLFSFLESQVNNWAASNIKGVDLSFGIDQYNQTTNGNTQSTMTYSYQVSKSLFDDRFKIVVGGNYSTDDNPDENLSQNLINDISFEYYLNRSQTMLVRLFRHTGFESILEGEITQTGLGCVYRRKLSHLSQILPRFLRPKNYKIIR